MAPEQLLPDRSQRSGVALCFSGGGYRATLFHLGALRRLNELGVLPQVTTFCSVSGGSILHAQLALGLPWPLTAPIPAEEWDKRMTEPIRRFTAQDIRTGSVLKRWLPWKWLDDAAGVENLAMRYERWFPGALADLPSAPRFIFCSTDLAFGVGWHMEPRTIGDYQAGYATTPKEWSLGRTVGASSCFPPVFNPLPVKLEPAAFSGGMASVQDRESAWKDLRINDGGTYDNLGLEPVWKDHAAILCSDGGGPFVVRPDTGLLGRIGRYIAIQYNQTVALRERWLIASYQRGDYAGAFWGAKSARASYGLSGGYSKDLARDVISQIRTDLDGFTDAEQCVLENHGYLLADAAIVKHASQLGPVAAPLQIPYPEWMDETRVRAALKDSRKLKILGHR
jgi:NTE family protein